MGLVSCQQPVHRYKRGGHEHIAIPNHLERQVVAAIGKGTEFKNGSHFSAWLGLVPRQHSSGDKQVLMNMTKKGDKHLRTLFIHGARAVVRVAANNNEGYLNQWVNQLKERRGFNKTTVAVANKNARIIWSILHNETEYRPAV
ncbi:Transposase IS116/IS110/IS902 family [Providencia rustigianii]|nr:Transposase IS116/IS110/IS902 family [Providencia rustigianii]